MLTKLTGIVDRARTLLNMSIDARMLQQIRGVFDGYTPTSPLSQATQNEEAAGGRHGQPANLDAVLPHAQIPQLSHANVFRLGAPLNTTNTPIPLTGAGWNSVSAFLNGLQMAMSAQTASASLRSPRTPSQPPQLPKQTPQRRKLPDSKELSKHHLDGVKDWSAEGITHPDQTYSHSNQRKPLPSISTIQKINLSNPKFSHIIVDQMTSKQVEALLRDFNANRHVKGAAIPRLMMKWYANELVDLFSEYYTRPELLDCKNPAYDENIVRELFVKRDAITEIVKEKMNEQKKADKAAEQLAQELLKRKATDDTDGVNKKLRTESSQFDTNKNVDQAATGVGETATGTCDVESDGESLDTQLPRLAGSHSAGSGVGIASFPSDDHDMDTNDENGYQSDDEDSDATTEDEIPARHLDSGDLSAKKATKLVLNQNEGQ